MRTLIYLEIKKFPLKSHFAGLLAANMIVFLLSIFTSSLLAANGDASALTSLPPVQLDTLTLAGYAYARRFNCLGGCIDFHLYH